MKAWVKTDGSLRFCDVPPPIPREDELLVRVEAISLNRGEVRTVARAGDGVIPGWDVAGSIAETAANGRGATRGTRVAALVSKGAWAEFVAVPVTEAATIPDGLDTAVAATLPIAGLTVLRALGVAGSLVGKKVLITGGSGGVGQLAVQLSAIGGARVTAVTSNRANREVLRELGAGAVIDNVGEASELYDLILESVGGDSLATAIDRVAQGGVVVTIGNSSEEDTRFNARTLYAKGGATVYGLLVFEEVQSRRIGAADLENLMVLAASGKVRSTIQVTSGWSELAKVLDDLENRRFSGKAVLRVA